LREREATHEKATDWVEERKRLSERERLHMRKQQIGWKRERDTARERERERKEQIRSQDLTLAGVNATSLASRISCRRRRPPDPSNTGH
jgi:ATP-dependent helicase YprA (DUF1998 family)